MKYVGIGTIMSILGVVFSILIWGTEKAHFLSGLVGGILIIFALLMSGSMGSGDRMRANFATETKEDRDERNHIMNNALWLALPNIIVAIFAYYM
ncbi:DUF5316 domain-containing protein [Lysinibacillus sp. fkY74-1]|nr:MULTISPECIES: DUF5316 domain-containing protein [Lysinibacillus]MBE5082482.1 DUF5316 domain-containing protein [Bacillus thuringiensis]AMO33866.1 hypothetical protein AR327_16250 [Lysinibacillus sphaericus]AMR91024.1 hypothetical protein A1T07_12960 [Lysinibacillus sphaericus]ANA45074.1 hypothetical protein A2J09_05630 [Lysinibacillus sphaericus]KZL44537.1 hypothetical protein A2J08_06255 [Lysinibacillus sphaericus]